MELIKRRVWINKVLKQISDNHNVKFFCRIQGVKTVPIQINLEHVIQMPGSSCYGIVGEVDANPFGLGIGFFVDFSKSAVCAAQLKNPAGLLGDRIKKFEVDPVVIIGWFVHWRNDDLVLARCLPERAV